MLHLRQHFHHHSLYHSVSLVKVVVACAARHVSAPQASSRGEQSTRNEADRVERGSGESIAKALFRNCQKLRRMLEAARGVSYSMRGFFPLNLDVMQARASAVDINVLLWTK